MRLPVVWFLSEPENTVSQPSDCVSSGESVWCRISILWPFLGVIPGKGPRQVSVQNLDVLHARGEPMKS